MNKKNLEKEADTFRYAIEKARDAGEFDSKSFNRELMSNFPKDCCDDTADLFTHYLFQKYNVDSIRIDGEYYDERYGHCYHCWQETDGWLIDLTGDQFENDPAVPIKTEAVYVGKMDEFHGQFKIVRSGHSCGIECLGSGSWKRMYDLYNKIMKYME